MASYANTRAQGLECPEGASLLATLESDSIQREAVAHYLYFLEEIVTYADLAGCRLWPLKWQESRSGQYGYLLTGFSRSDSASTTIQWKQAHYPAIRTQHLIYGMRS